MALQKEPKGGSPGQWLYLAMAHWQLGEKDQARQWYDRAAGRLERRPSDAELLRVQGEAAEVLGIPGLVRGDVHAERGDWERAAADYALAFAKGRPKDPQVWHRRAYLLLQVGDSDGYRKLCGQMREQFGKSKEVEPVALLAHTCAHGPDALGDVAAVLRLAEQRLTLTKASSRQLVWSVHVLGLAHYRAGQHEKAIECLGHGVKEHPKWGGQVLNWLVLAMAHKRLGHAAEARRWFDQADRWIGDTARNQSGNAGRRAPPGWSWSTWLGVRQLHREAWKLLREDDGP
jgi:tetratricopeptide (TPR) repeat protein